jgi:O-antigen/teichoic acid export membrane protein
VAQSLLAESAHHPGQRGRHVRHAAKMLTLILVPGVTIAVLIAPYLLRIFGRQYASGGTIIFQILALGTVFVAVSSVCNVVLNIEHRSSGIVVSRAVLLVVTLVLTVVLLPLGLPGIGLAMVAGYGASNLVYVYYLSRKPKPDPKRGWPIWPPSKPFDV